MQTFLKPAALALALAAALPAYAQQAEGNWLVRGRAVYLDMEHKSSATRGALAGVVPSDGIEVNSKWIPEVDISYFFTKNLAAELVLTVPQEQDVKITKGALKGTKLGTFEHLPPSLLLQWHFNPDGDFRPYVGAGINYTKIMNDKIDKVVPGLSLENDSFGFAAQIGFDYKIAPQWFVNVDVKKVQIRSDVRLNGSKVSDVTLDPWLLGVGVGYRF